MGERVNESAPWDPIPDSVVSAAAKAELALIGSALVDGKTLDQVFTRPEEFGNHLRSRIWATMRALRDRGSAIDELTVEAALPESVRESVRSELVRALTQPAVLSNVEHYAKIVNASHTTRRVLSVCAEVSEQHRRLGLEGPELLDSLLAKSTAIDTDKPSQAMPIGDLVRERFGQVAEAFDAFHAGKRHLVGVTSGIAKLDEFLCGFPVGVLTVIAGRPGMGKSALGVTISDAATPESGAHVFSLEDARWAYGDRIVARHCNISAQQIRSGRMSAEQFKAYQMAAEAYHGRAGYLVDDQSGVSAEDIARRIRREKRSNNTRIVIVDYLQLIKRPRHARSLHEANGYNVNYLADVADNEGIALILMSQLNRSVEETQDKIPSLRHLRESGTIEERAKCVVFCYRPHYYGLPAPAGYSDAGHEASIDLIVAKNSNGRLGTVKCRWDGPTTRVY